MHESLCTSGEGSHVYDPELVLASGGKFRSIRGCLHNAVRAVSEVKGRFPTIRMVEDGTESNPVSSQISVLESCRTCRQPPLEEVENEILEKRYQPRIRGEGEYLTELNETFLEIKPDWIGAQRPPKATRGWVGRR